MVKKLGHGKAVDWYLLGVLFYEMLTGLPPYYAEDKYACMKFNKDFREELFQNIMNDELVLPEHASDLCRDLLAKVSIPS